MGTQLFARMDRFFPNRSILLYQALNEMLGLHRSRVRAHVDAGGPSSRSGRLLPGTARCFIDAKHVKRSGFAVWRPTEIAFSPRLAGIEQSETVDQLAGNANLLLA